MGFGLIPILEVLSGAIGGSGVAGGLGGIAADALGLGAAGLGGGALAGALGGAGSGAGAGAAGVGAADPGLSGAINYDNLLSSQNPGILAPDSPGYQAYLQELKNAGVDVSNVPGSGSTLLGGAGNDTLTQATAGGAAGGTTPVDEVVVTVPAGGGGGALGGGIIGGGTVAGLGPLTNATDGFTAPTPPGPDADDLTVTGHHPTPGIPATPPPLPPTLTQPDLPTNIQPPDAGGGDGGGFTPIDFVPAAVPFVLPPSPPPIGPDPGTGIPPIGPITPLNNGPSFPSFPNIPGTGGGTPPGPAGGGGVPKVPNVLNTPFGGGGAGPGGTGVPGGLSISGSTAPKIYPWVTDGGAPNGV